MKCEKRIWGLLGPLGPELLLMKSQPFKAGGKEKQLGRTWKNHHKLFLLFLVSCLFVLTQLLSWVTTKEFRVFGPSDPIVAAPGGEAILPCSVFPAMNVENMEELRWFRSRFSEAVLVYRDQKEQKREQMPGYSRRTLLVKDKFHQGTVAVRIQNVQASDSGLYICHFKQGVFYEEAILELKVAAMGSVPEVRIKGPEDGGVSVVCNTSGWYPKPQVHWRDFRGENLTASSEIHHEDAQGLFSTETSLVVRDSSVRSVTCSIFNPILGQEKAMAIFIPGAVMVELARRQAGYRAAWRKAQLYADWRKEHFQAWTFTLDPASAHTNLAISQDRLTVTRKDFTRCLEDLSCVLGIRGISSGRYYWEVKLTNIEGSKWILGVCREGVVRKNFYFETPRKGFWTVGQSSKGHWAYIDSGRTSLSVRQAPKSVGVFVDYTEGDISFYNMSDMSHMFSFPKASFSGTLFPYFRLRSGNVSMIINSMECASESSEGEEGRRGRKRSRRGGRGGGGRMGRS